MFYRNVFLRSMHLPAVTERRQEPWNDIRAKAAIEGRLDSHVEWKPFNQMIHRTRCQSVVLLLSRRPRRGEVLPTQVSHLFCR